ncbi:hypothetical protein [Francisella sp. XLW-1]|uniref:hypothetical protein n=1 Tax=Francisella sp. XLW-1 TaxID=2610887 RepID=UPI00123D303C|nr:hypothetical protein [Francisella sp. XLW-1]
MSKFSDIKKKKIDNFIDESNNYQNKAIVDIKEPTERLNVEIPKSMHKAIKLKSVEEDRKIRDIVIEAINDHLNK